MAEAHASTVLGDADDSDRGRRSPERDALWVEAGRDLHSLHEIRLGRFGPVQLDSAGGSPAGSSDTWNPFVDEARKEGLPYLAEHDVFPDDVAAALIRRLDDVAAEVSSFSDGRLLHGDLEGGHIYATDDRYVGMIDFDQAQAGDPRWDLARVPLWDGDQALDLLLHGYGSNAITAEERDQLLPAYLLAFVVKHASKLLQADARANLDELLKMSRYERLL